MKITFKSENGLCPTFIIDDTRYVIESSYAYVNDGWREHKKDVYRLICRPNRDNERHKFHSKEACIKFLKCGLDDGFEPILRDGKFIKDANGKEWAYFEDSNSFVSAVDHLVHYAYSYELVEHIPYTYLSDEFYLYNECLKFAKNYITKKHEKKEATLFDYLEEGNE